MDELIEVIALGHPRSFRADRFSCIQDLPDGGASVTVDICGVKYPGVLTAEMKAKRMMILVVRRLGGKTDSIDWPASWKLANEPDETAEGVQNPER